MEIKNSETEKPSSDDSSSTSNSQSQSQCQRRVGILYDERMCKHSTPDGDHHPENPNRIRAIWNKLQIARIPQRCVVLNAKEAEDRFILNVHSKKHVDLIKNISSKEFDSRRNKIAAKFNSIYFNEGSSESAYLAAGSVVDVAERVAKGELNSAFAIVRPPGHHAEHNEAMGFCLHNNVAIATSFLLNERPELGIKKILIVDWDVHHGNGTQKMFWKDSRVLFFSVHRHEFGNFYPANDDGFYTMIGEGPGAGYNINVPWENGRCGDADYLAVWDHILIPVAKEFNPDIIIISAGFDAAVGDPLGGCRVTPYGYSVMLKKLMNFAQGKIVLALEGGYNLDSIANSALACMQVLLENMPINGSSEAYPFESTWRVIQAVRQELKVFWPTLADELPTTLISQTASVPVTQQVFVAEALEQPLLLPRDMEGLRRIRQPDLFMSLKRDLAMVTQQVFVAEEYLKRAGEDVKAEVRFRQEAERQAGALRQEKADLAGKLKEAEKARLSAEAGLRTAERQAEDQRQQLHITKIDLATEKQRVIDLMVELQKAKEAARTAREVAEAAVEAAYERGVLDTEKRLSEEVVVVCRDYCAESWGVAMDRAGVPTDSELRRVESIFFPEDIREVADPEPPPHH